MKGYFEPQVWSYTISNLIDAFREMNRFMGHAQTLSAYQDYILDPNAEHFEAEKWLTTDNIQSAWKIYTDQMVVVAATHIELILHDFLVSVFCAFPLMMHDYLHDSDVDANAQIKNGFVSLKDVVMARTRNDLYEKWADTSATNALQGKFPTNLKFVEKITKVQIGEPLRTNILSIVLDRNRIVHEGVSLSLTGIEVEARLKSCEDFLWHLLNTSISIGMAVPPSLEGVGEEHEYFDADGEIVQPE